MLTFLKRLGTRVLVAADRVGLVAEGVWHAAGAGATQLLHRSTSHDRHWKDHPAVPTGDQLTFGQRAADVLKAIVATWTALWIVLAVIGWWLWWQGIPRGSDGTGYLHLNLALSCFAALQCFILLIAAKRADQIAAAIALHTLQNTDTLRENTETIKTLVEQNTALTQQNADQAQQLKAQGEQHANDMALLQSQVNNNAAALAVLLAQVSAQHLTVGAGSAPGASDGQPANTVSTNAGPGQSPSAPDPAPAALVRKPRTARAKAGA